MSDTEHTLLFSVRLGIARENVGRAVSAELTPDTMVRLILQSGDFWKYIESFITLVMRFKDLDGRFYYKKWRHVFRASFFSEMTILASTVRQNCFSFKKEDMRLSFDSN